MRILAVVALLASLCTLPAAQTPHTLKTTITQQVEVGYWLHLPAGYDAKSDKKWPTILFLHGAGERGDNLEVVKKHGPTKIAESDANFPFIVISPQCPSGRVWRNHELIALLDAVTAEHNVDTKRIYLTGLSMGGYGTWSMMASHADRFAAAAPICGGGNTIEIRIARRDPGNPLRTIPVWCFHGAKDSVVPLNESERMVETLKGIGNENVKLTVYPEANHDSWTESYNNPELYKWFLEHTLP